VTSWHEEYGAQKETIEVADNDSAVLNFSFRGCQHQRLAVFATFPAIDSHDRVFDRCSLYSKKKRRIPHRGDCRADCLLYHLSIGQEMRLLFIETKT
jgi:hypothetical protein